MSGTVWFRYCLKQNNNNLVAIKQIGDIRQRTIFVGECAWK